MFDKEYPNRKDWRKPYRGAPRCDRSCRPHAGCPWCLGNRLARKQDKRKQADEEIKEVVNDEP